MHYIFSEAGTVWLGIASLMTKILQEAGALKAYRDCCCNTKNNFLEIAQDALGRQLLMDISKFFDRPTICGNENCSIPQLRKMCLAANDTFTDGENESIIRQIDSLCESFENIISKDMRNKRLAHFDLVELFSSEQTDIFFDALVELISELGNVVSKVGMQLLLMEVTYPTIDDYTKSYEKAIAELQIKT